MTIVRRASPLGELVSLRQAMDRLFEDSFVRPRTWAAGSDASPLPLDVTTTPDALLVEAALPGVDPEQVEITVEGGTLTIRAESRTERSTAAQDGEILVQEIRRGSVSRAIALPSGLEPDKASATFEHGMLQLRIPRAEAVKPRQIRISPTIDGRSAGDADQGPSGSNGSTPAEEA